MSRQEEGGQTPITRLTSPLDRGMCNAEGDDKVGVHLRHREMKWVATVRYE